MNKKVKNTGYFLVFIIISIIVSEGLIISIKNKIYPYIKKQISSSISNSEPLTRKEIIEKQFSMWDGSHKGLTSIIKRKMNDPKSYEHVETRYFDEGDYLIIITSFRGKNSFGATVLNTLKAKADINGNVTELIEVSYGID